jgi:predicted nucleic acid-binding protein
VSKDYLLDTNILSAFVQLKSGGTNPQRELLEKKLKDRQNSKIWLCPICIGEVQRGILIARDKKEKIENLQRDINSALSSFHGVLEINEAVAVNCYAVLWARLFNHYAEKSQKEGNPEKIRERERLNKTYTHALGTQENDLWLAAVAMSYNLILVTKDKMDHLKTISNGDVAFENWLKP